MSARSGEIVIKGLIVLDGAGETLVLLGIVVLQRDLQLDGLGELALLLAVRRLQHDADRFHQ